MPGSVLVEIDELRRTIPEYREKREESLRLAYTYAASAIEEGLKKGRNVIVDKTILQPEVLQDFIALANKHDAEVVEFFLFAEKECVQKRAEDRGYKPGGMLTPEKLVELWDSADELRSQRTDAIVIDTTHLSSEEVFALVAKRSGL